MPAEAAESLTRAPTWPATLMRTGLWMIGLGLLLVVVSGPTNRLGLAGFQVALLALALGVLLLALGVLLAIIGLLVANAKGVSFSKGAVALAILVGLGVIGYLLSVLRAGQSSPPIHEISTDLASPPAFVAIREIRESTPGTNPSDYVAESKGRAGVIDVPEAQRKSYPDIQPLVLEGIAPAEAFPRVESAARALGWEIVAAVPAEGRLEATDTTRFFGFKDDVVVRLRAEAGGTRIDVRSKSRVGLGDLGTNARRVRAFLDRVRAG